ncbi:MAG TPA: protealysin inhibitor emfourin [Nitrososphaeraceae archaeon]|nr:protealysin inhibitor emfourin [Nitrososphaeraceae archaeon]
MIIKVERTGGLTGISVSKELKVDDLPSKLETIVKEKIIDSQSSSIPLKSTPKGSADYFTYRISIQDGPNRKVIECSQFNIHEDLKFLIKYVEKHSIKK